MRLFLFSIITTILLVGCSKPSAEEMFNKGVEAQKSDQYDAAIEAYQQLVKTYPDSARTPEAYYAIATIYQNNKKSYYDAIQNFRLLIAKFPDHSTASSASFLIGFIYNNDLKKLDSARIAYEDFLKRYPTNHLVEAAQFELNNLGKSPDEIMKEQSQLAQKETKSVKKGKK